MDAFNDLMIRRQTASAVTTATLVLLTYAAAYLLVGLMLLRRRANTLLIASRHFQRVFHPRCGQLGCNPIEKPLGSFLFLGPIGVGKTELTLEFARYLFGDHHVYRVDMSEFLHGDNVKRLQLVFLYELLTWQLLSKVF
jgi:hypothetical protein